MKRSNVEKIFICSCLIIITCVMSVMLKDTKVFNSNESFNPIYRVDRNDKKIALTFDSGYAIDNTDDILKILDKYNVKCTFFPLGGWIKYHNDTLKEMVEKGHEIGNHTYNHPHMNNLGKEKIIKEVSLVDAKIREITGVGTKFFRPPYGEYNDKVIKTVEDLGYIAVQWDVDSVDWKNIGIDEEYNKIIKNVKSGSIVLFHNEGKYTPKVLEKLIPKLQEEGYSFVTLSQLVYDKDYYIDRDGTQHSIKK